MQDLPIGVFDSGVGGLTVLKALQQQLPQESFLYLGDTARLPYGTKSPDTVKAYASQASEILIKRGIKCLVVACNTASTVALEALQEKYPNIPVLGVVEPAVEAAAQLSKCDHIAVMATEATVASHGYHEAISAIMPNAKVVAESCSLFVSLAEEGWIDGPIAEAISQRYIDSLWVKMASKPDCLILGCTHFPVLTKTLQKIVGDDIVIIDSASTTAAQVSSQLKVLGLHKPEGESHATTTYLVTDCPSRFARVAKQFVGLDLHIHNIELVDLG